MALPETSRRSTAVTSLRLHPVLTAVTVATTTGLALGLALVQPTSYTAEARLAVAGGDLAAQAVPGYALASQELAANYARYVNNSDDQTSLEQEIDVRAGSITAVQASPVPESNVVRIEVDAVDPRSATSAAAAVADSLIARVEAASTEEEAAAVLAEFTTISTDVAEAEQAAAQAQGAVGAAGADADAATRGAASEAAARLSVLRVQQEALGQRYRTLVDTISSVNLTVVEPAEVTGDDRASRAQRYGLAGAVVGLLLALGLAQRGPRRGVRAPGSAGGGHRLAPTPQRPREMATSGTAQG